MRYVLEGGVRKWGDQIGIEIGLIDAREGAHRVWSESYRRRAGDFIALQQDITLEVITSLKIRLTEGEQERINRVHGTRNLEAWLAAAQGEKHLRRITEGDVAVARAYYERALALDPDYPAERLELMIGDAEAALVVSESNLAGRLSVEPERLLLLDEAKAELERCSGENPGPRAGAENLAYMIYTSGSTGRPKAVKAATSATATRSASSAYSMATAPRSSS